MRILLLVYQVGQVDQNFILWNFMIVGQAHQAFIINEFMIIVVQRRDDKGGSSVEACSFNQRSYRGIPVQCLTAKCLLAWLRSII